MSESLSFSHIAWSAPYLCLKVSNKLKRHKFKSFYASYDNRENIANKSDI